MIDGRLSLCPDSTDFAIGFGWLSSWPYTSVIIPTILKRSQSAWVWPWARGCRSTDHSLDGAPVIRLR